MSIVITKDFMYKEEGCPLILQVVQPQLLLGLPPLPLAGASSLQQQGRVKASFSSTLHSLLCAVCENNPLMSDALVLSLIRFTLFRFL